MNNRALEFECDISVVVHVLLAPSYPPSLNSIQFLCLSLGVLKEFLTGEAQLETFLRDHCLGSTDPTTVTKELQETVDTLNKIATKDKGQKVGLHVDNYCWFSLIGNNSAV